jgi:protein SCO1/2
MMHRHLVFLGALAVILATTAPATSQNAQWGRQYLPNVPVVTQKGHSLRFYDDVLKGKISVISLIYTSCQDICPVVTARLAQLEDKLGESVGRDVFFVSISVDPVNDTPEKLREYAEAFQAGPGWTFLTGEPENIKAIRYKLGDRGISLSEHRNEIMLYNDNTGEWERSSAFGDLNVLALTVRAMDPASRHPVRGAEDQKPQLTNSHGSAGNSLPKAKADLVEPPGQAVFIRLCSGCHTIGRGDRVGPDLLGLSNRRSRDWITRIITGPENMRLQGDPIAGALAAKFPAVRMPNLGMSDQDAGDLIAYVDAKTYGVEADKKIPLAGHHDHHHHKH